MTQDGQNQSRHRLVETHKIWRGLAIIKVAASPYWRARYYDRVAGKYVVRSTKETLKRNAIKAAEEMVRANTLLAPAVEAKPEPTPTNMTFEHFARLAMDINRINGKKFALRDDEKLLNRKDDGLLAYFGDKDIRSISSADITNYFIHLAALREEDGREAMAESTKAKHIIVLGKVFQAAVNANAIGAIPAMKSFSVDIAPRPSFTDEEYKELKDGIVKCAERGDKVKGKPVTLEMLNIVEFIKYSFVRPTQTELYGIKLGHITVRTDVDALEIKIDGKTKKRVTITMPEAIEIYRRQIRETGASKRSDYLFFPHLTDRAAAVTAGQQLFNHILNETDLKKDTDGEARSLYSCRHYALQNRLRESGGEVNIYNLAKNAGTSVEMLEKFYIRKSAPSAAEIKNLHSVTVPRKPKTLKEKLRDGGLNV